MLKLHLEILYNFRGSLVGLWLTPSDYNDEGALVKGAKELGFFFKTRTPNTVTVEVVSNPHKHHMSLLFLLLYNDKLDWHVQ